MYNHFMIMRMHITRNESVMFDCYDSINHINFEIQFNDSRNGMAHYADLIEKYKNYMKFKIELNIDEIICNFSERKIKIKHNNVKEGL